MEKETSFPELASAAEGCEILGVSRQRFQQLAAKDGFPPPVADLAVGRIWLVDDLRAHQESRPKRPGRVKPTG